jgi:hypothetical protein
MALLYELPSDAFPITLDFLVDSGIEGRDALRTTVDELLAQGILERRQNTERGRFARSGLYIAERWEK